MKALFDTNILIDHLKGIDLARKELDRFSEKVISIITWMEVLIGVRTVHEERSVKRFLAAFRVIPIDGEVAERAVEIRRELAIKLPDAIIYATSRNEGCLMVTRNTRDFDSRQPDVRVPYQL